MGLAACCMSIWVACNSPAPGASMVPEAYAGCGKNALAGSISGSPGCPGERATSANRGLGLRVLVQGFGPWAQ